MPSALESFDVIGGWRENYRALGAGKPVPVEVHGRPVAYRLGLPVDASGTLPNGRKFAGIDEFKKLASPGETPARARPRSRNARRAGH